MNTEHSLDHVSLNTAINILAKCNLNTEFHLCLHIDVSKDELAYVFMPSTLQGSYNALLEFKQYLITENKDVQNYIIHLKSIYRFLFDCMAASLNKGVQTQVAYYIPDKYNGYKPMDNRVYLNKLNADSVYRKVADASQREIVPKVQSLAIMKLPTGKWARLNKQPYEVI